MSFWDQMPYEFPFCLVRPQDVTARWGETTESDGATEKLTPHESSARQLPRVPTGTLPATLLREIVNLVSSISVAMPSVR